jgi:hypothetical protein
MSQIGVIVSCTSLLSSTNWSVDFSYQLDAGGTQIAQAFVGNSSNFSWFTGPTAALWASPNSTVTLSPNPPGTTNLVLLPCPPVVQAAAFGLVLK